MYVKFDERTVPIKYPTLLQYVGDSKFLIASNNQNHWIWNFSKAWGKYIECISLIITAYVVDAPPPSEAILFFNRENYYSPLPNFASLIFVQLDNIF